MKTDLEYLNSLMNVFTESESAHVNYKNITDAGVEIEKDGQITDKFVFHLQLLLDRQLIALRSGTAVTLRDIGIVFSLDNMVSICMTPLRLTQDGQDFAASLNNREVMDKLKSEFKDAPFTVVFEGGQKLLQHFMKKKLEKIME